MWLCYYTGLTMPLKEIIPTVVSSFELASSTTVASHILRPWMSGATTALLWPTL